MVPSPSRRLLHVLVAALLLPTVLVAQVAAPSAPTWQVERYVLPETGDTMPYGLYVPSSYDSTRTWPLLVGLHGAGTDHRSLLRYEGMIELAERYGVILVTPMGYNPVGGYGAFSGLRTCMVRATAPAWCEQGVVGGIVARRRLLPASVDSLSEADVMHVVDRVMARLRIDPRQVHLWGHSMGGGGTYHLAAKYPDRWAGLAVAAPAPPPTREQVARFRHLPILLLHGDDDGTVPVQGTRATVQLLKELGVRHEYVEIPGGDHSRFIARDRDMVARIFAFLFGMP